LIEKVFPITEAAKAYDEFKTAEVKPLIVLLQYDQRATAPVRRVDIAPISSQKRTGAINIALVGAGAFAKLVHLPNIAKLKEHYSLHAVMSKTGSNAKSTAQTFGAKYATTDYDEILRDKNVDAVLIATRHNLHAEMSIAALRVGKAVFVEKPMATCEEDLDKLVAAIQETGKPFMVGFNRRFSRYATEIKKHVTQRINPMIISYTMNAGYIPLDHWVHTEEGGGRIIGEACHIFDLFNYFIDEEIESVSVEKISPKTDHYSSTDNIVTMIKYADGSVCNLIYTSLGSSRFPKETCQIFFDGKVITLHDYKKLEGHGVNLKKVVSQEADKGQAEELLAFAQYVKGQSDNPIPLWQQIQATTISLCVGNSK
jgi:predicted dehydrogenase